MRWGRGGWGRGSYLDTVKLRLVSACGIMLTMSSSVSAARAYHHGDLRAALLAAARDLLRTQPARSLSLREVARRAGVSHAAPAHHFGDRQGLLVALALDCMTEFVTAQEQAAQPDPLGRLLGVGAAYVAYAAQHPQAFTLIFDPEICPPDRPSPLAPLIERNHALLDGLIREALHAGQLRSDQPQALAAALWGTVHGLAQLVLLGHLPPGAVPAALHALLTAVPDAADGDLRQQVPARDPLP